LVRSLLHADCLPGFYVETLGDLAKEPTKRGPAEVIVRDIANKFPEWGGSPCGTHIDLAINNLLGNRVELRYQIPRPGGRSVKSGVVFDQTPAEEAFQRWREGDFHEVERLAAAGWRAALQELDLVAVGKEMQAIGFSPKACKTLAEAKAIADALVNGTDRPRARLALAIAFFRIPQDQHRPIADAWQRAGVRTLAEFAPYAAYALTVEIFFQVALGARLIGGERPSDRTDIAYLFYLPFSMIFVSSDDLHRRTAPLFMRPEQQFVWGIDLKAALKAINEHFLKLPEEEREKGISKFAGSPPPGDLVADLWDQFMAPGQSRSRVGQNESGEAGGDVEALQRVQETANVRPGRRDSHRRRRDGFGFQNGAEETRELVASAKGLQGGTGRRLNPPDHFKLLTRLRVFFGRRDASHRRTARAYLELGDAFSFKNGGFRQT
jgi:hypothetical protein